VVGNWKQALLKEIDADQLPVHWGGTRTDPDGDPFCKSQVKASVVNNGITLASHAKGSGFNSRSRHIRYLFIEPPGI
jgi:hypothetical protein